MAQQNVSVIITTLSCGVGGERISRHNHLRDALFDTAVASGLGPTKEGRFLLPDDGRRPADVLVPNWAGGRDAALDVTVVNPFQGATIAQAATTPIRKATLLVGRGEKYLTWALLGFASQRLCPGVNSSLCEE